MKNKVIKTCALGLCATTVFIGGPTTIVNAQEINESGITYTENVQTNIADKEVVKIEYTYSNNNDGVVYLYAINKNGEQVWNKRLKRKMCDEYEYWGFNGEQGSKYYYLNYNGKLYAIDIQTGEEVWSTKCDYQITSSIAYIEAKDRLVEIARQNYHHISVYDLKTGKLLKTVKDIEKKYIEPYEKNGWSYYLIPNVHYANKIVYVDVESTYYNKLNNKDIFDKETAHLKIDAENYKIEFVKSKDDLASENITDKTVTSVTYDSGYNHTFNGRNNNGEIVWSIPMYETGAANIVYNNYELTGADNKYYYIYRGEGKLYAINMQTGEKRWEADGNFEIGSMIEVNDKLVIATYQDDIANVFVYNKKTGKLIKKFENVLENVNNAIIPIIYTKDMHVENEIVYIPVDNYNIGGKVRVNERIGYLKLNTKKSKIEYEEIQSIQNDIPEKQVVKVKAQPWHGIIEGLNSDKKIVWLLNCEEYPEKLGFEIIDENNKNYYMYYNNKIYAIDMQTGEKLWTINSNTSQYANAKLIEDKLVVVTPNADANANIVVYDTKTGKVLKTVNNIAKYVPKDYGSVGIYNESLKVENENIYVEVYKIDSDDNTYSKDKMVGYLMIDIKNYKIKYVQRFHSIWY